MSKISKPKGKDCRTNKRHVAVISTEDLPFDIHACVQKGTNLFCAHTHGLSEIGLADFLMDPLAFDASGICLRIDLSVHFFRKPENVHLLNDVLAGKIVKLSMSDLEPSLGDAERYVYCYRLVDSDFEAVKQAYLTNGRPLPPGMRVIQIWVEGDDFALTNEYYAGGVKI